MNRSGLRHLDALEREVREYVAAGHRAFVVRVYLMAGGSSRFRMAQMQEASQQRLLDLGLEVTGLEHREWEYRVFFSCRLPESRLPEKICPMCAETVKAAAILCRYCGSDVSAVFAIPLQEWALPTIDLPDELPEHSNYGDGRYRAGTLMRPDYQCDEAGFRTEETICSACGRETVPFV